MNKKYTFLYSIIILFVFILNWNAINQQFVYYDVILPLTDSLVNNFTYNSNSVPAFYPLWGYPLLQIPGILMKHPAAWTLLFQYLLTIIGLNYFYKLFKISPKAIHTLLFLPFFALMSVKWPDAIIGFILLPFAYYLKEYYEIKKLKYLIISGIIIGIAANFRSEYLYLSLFLLVYVTLLKKGNKLFLIKTFFSLTFIMILCLLPWSIRSYVISKEFRFTATNGGAVSYISLGQLPNNKWNIQPFDSSSFALAKAHGMNNPYSPEADKFFKQKVYSLILDNPGEFAKKCLHNFSQIFYRGVYTGEFANTFISFSRRMEINNYLISKGGQLSQLKALFALPTNESIPILIEKLIQLIYMPITLALIINLIVLMWKNRKSYDFLLILISGIFVYRIITISLIQYEYRHVNPMYMFLLGIFLLNAQQNQIIWIKLKEKFFRLLKNG